MTSGASATRPRRDGCYVFRGEDGVWEYIKFLTPDLVLTASSTFEPRIFAAHLAPAIDAFSYGQAALDDDGAICVTTINSDGAVDYRIQANRDGSLRVSSHSHVNDAEFDDRFVFYPS